MKPMLWLIFCTCSAPLAWAYPSMQETMYEQFDLWQARDVQKAQCAYCHTSQEVVQTLNPFGSAVQREFKGEAKQNFGEALYLAVKSNTDSDKDSFSDALEIIAGSFPGDAKSKPKQTKTELEDALKKRGGLESFRPKSSR
jgi:hypothetical protein